MAHALCLSPGDVAGVAGRRHPPRQGHLRERGPRCPHHHQMGGLCLCLFHPNGPSRRVLLRGELLRDDLLPRGDRRQNDLSQGGPPRHQVLLSGGRRSRNVLPGRHSLPHYHLLAQGDLPLSHLQPLADMHPDH